MSVIIKGLSGNSGTKVYIDNVLSKEKELRLKATYIDVSISTTPYSLMSANAVIYNGYLHLLSNWDSDKSSHYRWNGYSWTSMTSIPYYSNRARCVVHDGSIHIIGSHYNSNYGKYHYKWDGSSWSIVSTLPYQFYDSGVVTYNNEIHIMGGQYSSPYNKYHYKWNGTSWASVSTLPHPFISSNAIIFNNEIHILGSGYYEIDDSSNQPYYPYKFRHYKWNGSKWTSVSTLPYGLQSGSAIVYNNTIHILGGGDISRTDIYKHYKLNESKTSWTNQRTLPIDARFGCVAIYNNEMHILNNKNHYVIDRELYNRA